MRAFRGHMVFVSAEQNNSNWIFYVRPRSSTKFQFGQIQLTLGGDSDHRIELQKAGDQFMELQQFCFAIHGHHQVEIKVVKPWEAALLEAEIGRVFLEQPFLAATEPILGQLWTLQDDAGGALHLEQVILEY